MRSVRCVVLEAIGEPVNIREMEPDTDGALEPGALQYTDHVPTPLNPHLITRKQLTPLGSWAFSEAHHVEYLGTLPQLLARFPLEQLVTAFPLERTQAAIDAARTGRVGKAVLVP